MDCFGVRFFVIMIVLYPFSVLELITPTSILIILDISKPHPILLIIQQFWLRDREFLIANLLLFQQLLEADVVNNSADGLDVLLQPGGAPAFLPLSHLSDHQINCKALLSVYSPSTKLTNVVYYGRSKDKSMVSLYICVKLLALYNNPARYNHLN